MATKQVKISIYFIDNQFMQIAFCLWFGIIDEKAVKNTKSKNANNLIY
jgi:hypothetical protein